LKIQREIGDWNGVAINSFNIGKNLFYQNKQQEGLKYIIEAYKINQQVGNYELEQALIKTFKQLGLTKKQLQKYLKQT